MINGDGSLLAKGHLVCHVLLIEGSDGLVLVDTGFGIDDVRHPRQLGMPFRASIRPELIEDETAIARLRDLGFDPADVRHIVVTHLDLDHAGGLPDFPDAEVHVFATEHAAALSPRLRERPRYIKNHWAHGPRWITHELQGDDWHGFESVRVLPGTDPEVLLVPLAGHSRGHSAIAVNRGDGWLLHCGDAYFNHGEVESPPSCPSGLALFQTAMAADNGLRKQNQERLRELAQRHGDGVELICSHDPHDLRR